MLRGQVYWCAGQLYQHTGDLTTAAVAYAKAAESYHAERAKIDKLDGYAASMREMMEFCLFAEHFDPETIPDGVYTGSSLGYSTHINVEVEMRAGRFERVDIGERLETSPLDSFETVPQRIIEEQSLNVDWVPGAKHTSRAIVAATFRALDGAVTGLTRKSGSARLKTSGSKAVSKSTAYRVLAVRELTDSTFVVRFDRNGMEFQPGHHIDVGIRGDNAVRKYSIYSSPDEEFLEILVIEVTRGRVSPKLRQVKPGDELTVDGPTGLFLISPRAREESRFLFVATGTGISPFRCFARSYSHLDYQIVHGVRYRNELYEHSSFPSERVVACVSRESAEDQDGIVTRGRVTDYLRDHPPDPKSYCYLCGNADMIYDVATMLKGQGVSAERIYAEEYF